jgi:hypothetical protein
MVPLAQGVLARLRLADPHPRPAERVLGKTGPEGVHRPLPPFPGSDANRRMRTRTSGGVGGAGVNPAPTRSIGLRSRRGPTVDRQIRQLVDPLMGAGSRN